MAVKGYSTQALVEDELGQPLTAAQAAYLADPLLEQAERLIDQATGRRWLTGVITSEPYRDVRVLVVLKSYPVASIQAVSWRASLGGTETSFDLTTEVELQDADAGLLWLAGAQTYNRVLVSYTPVDASVLTSDDGLLVRRAATLLLADWLRPLTGGVTPDVQQFSVGGGDLAVTYRGRALLSPQVTDILERLSSPRIA